VTAATLLDDAVQATAVEKRIHHRPAPSTKPVFPASPVTSWFVRVTFPGVLPAAAAVARLVTSSGLPVERVAEHATVNSRWLLIGPRGRRDVDAALTRLTGTHRIDAVAFRRI
jgi:hypothetical protein